MKTLQVSESAVFHVGGAFESKPDDSHWPRGRRFYLDSKKCRGVARYNECDQSIELTWKSEGMGQSMLASQRIELQILWVMCSEKHIMRHAIVHVISLELLLRSVLTALIGCFKPW